MTVAEGRCERVAAPAKLNLCLQIAGRRDDGYHLVDSVVVFTAFGDRLTIYPTDSADSADTIDIGGPFAIDIADEPDNICLRAISGYRDAGGVIGPLSVTLDKHIPVGAGLGGGSSDAAAVLRYLERNATTRLAPDDFALLALDLGADVPVCLAGTAQHMTGIGEKLCQLDPAPQGHVVLARPDTSLSTIAVFKEFAGMQHKGGQNKGGEPPDLAPPAHDPRQIVQRGNDLAGAARRLCPEIKDLMDRMAQCEGAEAVQMSGSGSACFALFEDAALADASATHLAEQGQWAVATTF